FRATRSHVRGSFAGARRPTNSTSGSFAGAPEAVDRRDGTMATGTGIVASGTRGASLATVARLDEETVLTAANAQSNVRVIQRCAACARRGRMASRGGLANRSE